MRGSGEEEAAAWSTGLWVWDSGSAALTCLPGARTWEQVGHSQHPGELLLDPLSGQGYMLLRESPGF